jgi:hypothetical protein
MWHIVKKTALFQVFAFTPMRGLEGGARTNEYMRTLYPSAGIHQPRDVSLKVEYFNLITIRFAAFSARHLRFRIASAIPIFSVIASHRAQ